jgi:hypothetical protein
MNIIIKMMLFPLFVIYLINFYHCKDPKNKRTYQIYSRTIWHPLERKIIFLDEIKKEKTLPPNRIKVYYIQKNGKNRKIEKIIYFKKNFVTREDIYSYSHDNLIGIESYKNQKTFQTVQFTNMGNKGYKENIFKYENDKVTEKWTIVVSLNRKAKIEEMFFYKDSKFIKKIQYSYLSNGKLDVELVYENGKIYKRTRDAVFSKVPKKHIGNF